MSAGRPAVRRGAGDGGTAGGGGAATGRLLVASNRLPVVLAPEPDGDWRLEPGSGGLVTAMRPILRRSGGVWVGWPGVAEGEMPEAERLLAESTRELPYDMRAVPLTREEQEGFYLGASNQIIWPLFHDLQAHCHFDPSFWEAYEAVNRKFARAIHDVARPGDTAWVHDYHLMRVAPALRELGHAGPVGFFLHIPFPSPDLFVKLPWRSQVLDGLLAYDLIGFQTRRDLRNFVDCLRHLAPDASANEEKPGEETAREPGGLLRIQRRGAPLLAGAFPVSIDWAEFARDAASPQVRELVGRIRSELGAEQVILGVDRQDYSKGIPHKLRAFRHALEHNPDLRGRVRLLQLVVPSRESVPQYQELKSEIERLVGAINGRFTRRGWVPVHFVYGSWDRRELLAHYRAADVALVTPLKDGMNLVAKEYCACRTEEDGVLILSEFAGAADELGEEALLVNPYDRVQVAEAIGRALRMTTEEERRRMRWLRERVRGWDIFRWQEAFLAALGAVRGEAAPAG